MVVRWKPKKISRNERVPGGISGVEVLLSLRHRQASCNQESDSVQRCDGKVWSFEDVSLWQGFMGGQRIVMFLSYSGCSLIEWPTKFFFKLRTVCNFDLFVNTFHFCGVRSGGEGGCASTDPCTNDCCHHSTFDWFSESAGIIKVTVTTDAATPENHKSDVADSRSPAAPVIGCVNDRDVQFIAEKLTGNSCSAIWSPLQSLPIAVKCNAEELDDSFRTFVLYPN